MKNIYEAPFFCEFCDTVDNMYRLGWDERNGGNVSLLLDENMDEYFDRVLRTIPIPFDATSLAGKCFMVTGTGKYFKNMKKDPARNIGIFRISADGKNAELLWGYTDGGRFTSELPAHLMSHIARLSVDPNNRVVLHTHPTSLLAMTHIHPLDSDAFTHTLWQVMTESIVVFPEGVEVLPWMICGNNEIGVATAEGMKKARTVIWSLHGVYGCGKDLDEAFGLVETVEKAAQIYMQYTAANLPHINTIRDDQLLELAKTFGVTPRKGIL